MRIWKIYVVVCVLSSFCLGNDWYDKQQIEDLAQQITKVLKNNLENATQRKNIMLQIDTFYQNDQIEFRLAPRPQRDTFFVMCLQHFKDGKISVTGSVLYHSDYYGCQTLLRKYFPTTQLHFNISIAPIGYGIVHTAVADLYVEPRAEAGDNLASQWLYGTPLVVLEADKNNSFFRVQSKADGYIGWLQASSFRWTEYNIWQKWTQAPAAYLAEKYNEHPVGARFSLHTTDKNHYMVYDVTGKLHSIPSKNFASLWSDYNSQNIVSVAKLFLPQQKYYTKSYLWGGSSAPHLDCSGFVQLTYRLHNILLPRDADQQFQFSEYVPQNQMQPGDLIFFSSNGKRPTHVGIYLGDSKFIHCSNSGEYSGVKINSLQGETKYDKFLAGIYYAAGRIIPNIEQR